MSKPLHKVAIAMWLAGAAILLLWAWALVDFMYTFSVREGSFGGLVMGGAAGAVLVALGTIIELVDQIRWNTRPPAHQNGLRE
ncbi:MAG TPA: hypothetical protein VKR31_13270 [Rhizomicrobium sp.]|nr:hypothetical protein [Rhizomicrobium sp.]